MCFVHPLCGTCGITWGSIWYIMVGFSEHASSSQAVGDSERTHNGNSVPNVPNQPWTKEQNTGGRWLIPLSIEFQPSKLVQDLFHLQQDFEYRSTEVCQSQITPSLDERLPSDWFLLVYFTSLTETYFMDISWHIISNNNQLTLWFFDVAWQVAHLSMIYGDLPIGKWWFSIALQGPGFAGIRAAKRCKRFQAAKGKDETPGKLQIAAANACTNLKTSAAIKCQTSELP